VTFGHITAAAVSNYLLLKKRSQLKFKGGKHSIRVRKLAAWTSLSSNRK